MNKKIFIIAGESSGDIYGSYLIKLIKQTAPNTEIHAWGGDKMKSAGATIKTHIRDLSIMGIVEVIKNLGTIKTLLATCKKDIKQLDPDTVIFIDYPGFNLRMAKWAKLQNITTIQYISPKVWAWKESRVKTIKATIDHLICIFPFEVEFYQTYSMKALYFGNPLSKLIAEKNCNPLEKRTSYPAIGIMPGSRKQELRFIMPLLVDFINTHQSFEFYIGQMSLLSKDLYLKDQITNPNTHFIIDSPNDILSGVDLMINTSGTITLETLFYKKPQVVVYKAHALGFMLFKQLVKLPYISLPNIIGKRSVVTELIQEDFTVESLSTEVQRIQSNTEVIDYDKVLEDLDVRDEKLLVSYLLK
jgi:lipid-A-disaccharide synthase